MSLRHEWWSSICPSFKDTTTTLHSRHPSILPFLFFFLSFPSFSLSHCFLSPHPSCTLLAKKVVLWSTQSIANSEIRQNSHPDTIRPPGPLGAPPLVATQEKSLWRLSGKSYPTPADPPQLSTPPTSHSNASSLINLMSPPTPPNYEGNSVKTISSTGLNMTQILGNNVSSPYHHAHTCKSSSLTLVHMKTYPNRYKAYLTEENIESSSAHCPSQVGYCLHVHLPVYVVEHVILVLSLFHLLFIPTIALYYTFIPAWFLSLQPSHIAWGLTTCTSIDHSHNHSNNSSPPSQPQHTFLW